MLEVYALAVQKSLLKFIGTNIGGHTIYRFRETVDTSKDIYGEVRIQGPNTTNPSKDFYKMFLQVNFLLTARISKTKPFDCEKFSYAIMAKMMEVYKIPILDSDGNYLGDLTRDESKSTTRADEIWNMGKLGAGIDIQQGIYECHYKTEIL